MTRRQTSTYGFARTSKLLQERIRKASESRGFAQSRVLTHWSEIAGADMAGLCRPVEVTYSRGGFGATLTLLTTGANAPLVDMKREALRERINAIYGYNAISRIRVTQTASVGFADGQVAFDGAPRRSPEPEPETIEQARATAGSVSDDGLRSALERLAVNVISKSRTGRR